nr:MAG TPA: hypothetical protein [Caudoviricetes sp.]
MNGCLWKFNHSTDDRPERRPKKAPRLGAGWWNLIRSGVSL